jgi:conjugal transfer pilus assembly protein TraB
MERMRNAADNNVRRAEQKNRKLEHKIELLEQRMQVMEQDAAESKRNESNVINNITQALEKNVAQILSGSNPKAPARASAREPMLKGAVTASTPITIYGAKEESGSPTPGQAPVPEEARRWAYLPAGSYVKCTLLTPVDAPISKDDPMPVALRADTIFYGPNGSTVPLKNCMIIGAAWGDLNTEKAYVEVVKIVQVLEDGNVWEESGGKAGSRLGWVVDGLPGKTEYRINGILAKGALASFLSAAADALAGDQTSTTVSAMTGTSTTSITGETGKYAAYKGASGFAKTLAAPYLKLLEQSMPVIHVYSGKEVYIFTLKGMEVKGLEAKSESEFGGLY